MDRLLAMRSFIEVANTASFTKAADHLDMSRLQISRHVQEIESWLNQRLLHRTTRKVSLTEAGKEALIRCERILNETAALEVNALKQSQSLTGTIRVAAPIGVAQNLLIDIVETFTTLHPKVCIEIIASDNLAQLVDERIDIALRYTRQPGESLIARKLMGIEIVVCATPTYLQTHSEIKTPDDLLTHNCLLHSAGNQWNFIKDNQNFSVNVTGNIKANDANTLIQPAIHDKGIVQLSCDLANPLIETEQLVPILSDYTIPSSSLWAVYLSRSYQLPVVRQFIDFVAEHWSEDIRAC